MSAHISKRLRFQRIATALAILLLALGIGNLFYGSFKAKQYFELIETTNAQLAKPTKSIFPLIDPTVDTSRDQQQLRRLKGSQQFYQFVQRAGGWMIFFGLLTSAAGLMFSGPAPEQESDQQTFPPTP